MTDTLQRLLDKQEEIRVKIAVLYRCHGICEVQIACNAKRAKSFHHWLKESDGGTWSEDNIMGICWRCHQWIHKNEEHARQLGWLLK